MSKRTSNASDILQRKYIGNDPESKMSLELERVNSQVAQIIYDSRKDASLSQVQLADLIGTTQSVISRLEDADYNGHSLSMLSRIASVLNKTLIIQMIDKSNDN